MMILSNFARAGKGRQAATMAHGLGIRPQWHWTANDLAVACAVPPLLDVDQLQRAVSDCQQC